MTTNPSHPANGPVSLDRLHQISEILSKAAAQSDGGNLGYAMADAVKVIDGAIAAMNANPVAWRYRYVHTPKTEEHGSPFTTEWKLCDSKDECNPSDCFERQPLYTAPPATVVPEECPREVRDMIASHSDALFNDDDAEEIWNACRAAVLHGKSDGKPELTVWYGAMPETNGKTNWTAILHRKGQKIWEGITIDRSEYPDRVRYEADRMRYLIGELLDEPDILSYDADAHSGYVKPGNSPTTLDGWIPVSERMPERDVDVQVYCADKKEQMVGYMERNETEGWFRFASLPNGGGVYCKPTHWMPLPAEPKQEV